MAFRVLVLCSLLVLKKGLTNGFALKVTSPCHSERSEESALSSFENGFFVTTFLRMTFDTKPLTNTTSCGILFILYYML